LRQDGCLSIATYLRLFVTEYMRSDVRRLLYLDCDVIVCDDVGELWQRTSTAT
jgi:lipopolysaccharide biosynthesis glycosyltransferase